MKAHLNRISNSVGNHVKVVAATLLLSLTSTAAPAQEYPSGPIQVLVAFAAGGGTDTLARLLAPQLSILLGQPVTVQNLPGGGGQVAATALLRDGATGLAILATNEPDLFMTTVFNEPGYKAEDFHTIMVDLYDPRVMLVQPSSPFATLEDFITEAKAAPGTLTVGTTQGNAQELFAKWLFQELEIDVRLVGYPGGGAAANAMIAGDVTAAIGDDFARFNIRDQAKALFVAGENASPRWSEAQTLADAVAAHGVELPAPDFLARYGVYVISAAFHDSNPEGYAKLQQALVDAWQSDAFQAYLDTNGLQDLARGLPGEELAATFAGDFEQIAKMK